MVVTVACRQSNRAGPAAMQSIRPGDIPWFTEPMAGRIARAPRGTDRLDTAALISAPTPDLLFESGWSFVATLEGLLSELSTK